MRPVYPAVMRILPGQSLPSVMRRKDSLSRENRFTDGALLLWSALFSWRTPGAEPPRFLFHGSGQNFFGKERREGREARSRKCFRSARDRRARDFLANLPADWYDTPYMNSADGKKPRGCPAESRLMAERAADGERQVTPEPAVRAVPQAGVIRIERLTVSAM